MEKVGRMMNETRFAARLAPIGGETVFFTDPIRIPADYR